MYLTIEVDDVDKIYADIKKKSIEIKIDCAMSRGATGILPLKIQTELTLILSDTRRNEKRSLSQPIFERLHFFAAYQNIIISTLVQMNFQPAVRISKNCFDRVDGADVFSV